MAKRKKPNRRDLIEKLDDLHSKVVRLRGVNKFGTVECYTCGGRFLLSVITCGHWWSRNHAAIRWEFWNTKPQCRACQAENGMRDEYKLQLISELGSAEEVERLALRRFEIKMWTADELQEMIDERKRELCKLRR